MIRATAFKTLCAGFLEEGIRPLARNNAAHGVWTHPEGDWDLFGFSLEKLLHRCPMLGEIEHGDLICGMEAYTPDKAPTVGHSSQARGYYVLNGLNGQGLSLAGGLGDLVANWICDGIPEIDVANLDVGRFLELHANSQYLMERAPEIAAMTYSNMYHSHQFHTARNLRMSPIYHHLRDAGAVFGEIMGYERPLWFVQFPGPDRNALFQGQDALVGKPVWFDRLGSNPMIILSLK
ncbi:unnamed protein product [Cylicostephanus goldi]|uniref:FAD dependent oxidoreductase domain-containing protein n=1 Tax=Cylicostephanus goldi TaxID=71465 RepID=A0A3P6TID9_CYLGO|nr:unnamed protein product [Cylicostephanus goldi]